MKIMMFGHKSLPSRAGGVEVVVMELAVRLTELGHSVTCCSRGGKSGIYRGVRCKAMPVIPGKGLAAVSAGFFAAIYSAVSSAEVVHIHGEGPAFWCWILKLTGKRVVVTVHGLDWQREKWRGSLGSVFIRSGERAAVRFADEIIVLSRNVQQYFLREYRRKTIYIPNGTSLAEPVPGEGILRLGLKKDQYLLFLGRLVPEKGIHYLIEAFKDLKTEKKLVIAGSSSDTDAYAARLKEMASSDPRILFTGFAEGKLLKELYSNAYCYILPSDLEGMPLTLLEALGYGNCCVVSDIPECAEVVGSSALLFPKGDVDGLRSCLQQLCDAPETAAQYRQKALRLVQEKYSWEEIVRQTVMNCYENSDDQ